MLAWSLPGSNLLYAIVGIVIGVLLARWDHLFGHLHLTKGNLTLYVAVAITIVWLVSITVDLVDPNYDPPAGVNLAFGVVTTYLFVKNGKEVNEE
jgi:hypothetical protein